VNPAKARSPLVLLALLAPGYAHAHEGASRELARLERRLAVAPGDVDLRLRRARLLRRRGELGAALTEARRVRRLAPRDPRARRELGLVYSSLGRGAAARRELDRYLSTGALDAEALRARARIAVARGRVRAALADYDRAVAVRSHPDLFLERGELLVRQGLLERAQRGYEEGLRAVGDSVVLRRALVSVLLGRRRFAEALGQVEHVLDGARLRAPLYLWRAEVREAAGDRGGARRDRERALGEATRALARRPSALHRLWRAKAYVALGRKREAAEELRAALRLAPRLREARRLLAALEGSR
jgi:tetratricopeptide (TPR) repeat protein